MDIKRSRMEHSRDKFWIDQWVWEKVASNFTYWNLGHSQGTTPSECLQASLGIEGNRVWDTVICAKSCFVVTYARGRGSCWKRNFLPGLGGSCDTIHRTWILDFLTRSDKWVICRCRTIVLLGHGHVAEVLFPKKIHSSPGVNTADKTTKRDPEP